MGASLLTGQLPSLAPGLALALLVFEPLGAPVSSWSLSSSLLAQALGDLGLVLEQLDPLVRTAKMERILIKTFDFAHGLGPALTGQQGLQSEVTHLHGVDFAGALVDFEVGMQLAARARGAESCQYEVEGFKSRLGTPLVQAVYTLDQAAAETGHEDVFWEVLEQLKAAGAQGILVAPIERMIL